MVYNNCSFCFLFSSIAEGMCWCVCGGGWRQTGKEEECKQRVRDIVHVKIMPLGLFLTLFNFFFSFVRWKKPLILKRQRLNQMFQDLPIYKQKYATFQIIPQISKKHDLLNSTRRRQVFHQNLYLLSSFDILKTPKNIHSKTPQTSEFQVSMLVCF